MADEWQTPNFRQTIITRISEFMQNSAQDPTKNPVAMENHIFKKSRSKEEYISTVTKILMHLKEAQKKPQLPQSTNVEIVQQNMIPDPINALQNLASQGNRNSQLMPMTGGSSQSQIAVSGSISSNLLQTLNQQRPIQRSQMGGSNAGQGGPNISSSGATIMSQINSMQMNTNSLAQQNQIVGMSSQIHQMGSQGPSNANTTQSSASHGSVSTNSQLQINSNQMPNNSSSLSMNCSQGSQIQQLNQMNMNQMINARLSQGGSIGIGLNSVSSLSQNQNSSMQNASLSGSQQNQQINGGAVATVSSQSSNTNLVSNIPQKNPLSIPQSGQLFSVNRAVSTVGNVSGQQFLRQSPSPSMVPSPVAIGGTSQQQLQQQQLQQNSGNQQQVSNSQMTPSPALVSSSSPQMSGLLSNNQRNLRQSPLNTPGQIATNSPFNAQEDQLYREKYKQLTKYIEPLKRMMAKIGNDGGNSESKMTKTKMSKLLEILCNPEQRVPLETLMKCEKVLEKMDFVSYSGQQFSKSSNPLMDVISNVIQSPGSNHTLFRTFRPGLELLFGTDISSSSVPKKSRLMEKTLLEVDIPHILQGEIARLDQKFKVTLCGNTRICKKTIRLSCHLSDNRLPCVPPLYINIPEAYPDVSPNCLLAKDAYDNTPFLKSIQLVLMARLLKLPTLYSLSHLLETWEMSVRQACAPNACKY